LGALADDRGGGDRDGAAASDSRNGRSFDRSENRDNHSDHNGASSRDDDDDDHRGDQVGDRDDAGDIDDDDEDDVAEQPDDEEVREDERADRGPGFGRIISSLNRLDRQISDLGEIPTPIFQFVDVGDLLTGDRTAALQNALDRNRAALDRLLAEPEVAAALTEQGIAADQVVSASVDDDDGTVTIYTRAQATGQL
jgi:hypothetical protein